MSLLAEEQLELEAEIAKSIPRYPQLSLPLIKYEMIYNLKCNRTEYVSLPRVQEVEEEKRINVLKPNTDTIGDEQNIKYLWNSPRLMFLFVGGDINCAIHHIVQSLHNPFMENAVATLIIQECLLDEFKGRLSDRFHELPTEIANHPVYLRTIEKLKELKATTILGNINTISNLAYPIMVHDLCHNYLGDGPTGVITLHTFRTPKEATEVYLKETLKFSSACIFDEKLASAYEIIARIEKVQIFLINCYDIDLQPITAAFINDLNNVKVFKGYHYETTTFRKMRKVIVFPIGNIWAHSTY